MRDWYMDPDPDGRGFSIFDAGDPSEGGGPHGKVAQCVEEGDARLICRAVESYSSSRFGLLFLVGERRLEGRPNGSLVDAGEWVGDGGDSIRLVELEGTMRLKAGGRAATAADAFMADKCAAGMGDYRYRVLGPADGYFSPDIGHVERFWFGQFGAGELPVLTCLWVWAAPVVVAGDQ